MSRIILFFIMLASALSLSAQVGPSSTLEFKSGNFYQNGVKLDKKTLGTVLSQPELDLYNTGKDQRIIGYVCTPVGALSIIGGGFLMSDGFNAKANQSAMVLGDNAIIGPLEIALGAVLVVGGAACTTFGIIYLCKAHKTMLKVADSHNNPGQAITLGPSRNGLGLALNF